MRGRNVNQVDDADVDLTPMLDVVFILLIFFIVTADFTREQSLKLEPPPPPAPANVEQPKTKTIRIVVDENNFIFVNNDLTELRGVESQIERLKAENPESAVIIQVHPRSKSGLLTQLRDKAYDARVAKVNIVLSEE